MEWWREKIYLLRLHPVTCEAGVSGVFLMMVVFWLTSQKNIFPFVFFKYIFSEMFTSLTLWRRIFVMTASICTSSALDFQHRRNISLRFSRNSEAFRFRIPRKSQRKCSTYNIVLNMFTSSITHWYVTRPDGGEVYNFIHLNIHFFLLSFFLAIHFSYHDKCCLFMSLSTT